MNSATWALLADSSRGLLYSNPGKGKSWSLVKEYAHPASRVSEGGLTTDKAGRMHASGANGARSAMQSPTSPKEVEAEHFAHELAEALHAGHGQQSYKRIVLVAPPHFLGLLRKTLNATVSKLIGASADKDYMHLSEKDIHMHLDALVEGAR